MVHVIEVEWDTNTGSFSTDLQLAGGEENWDEFNPQLMRVRATLQQSGDTREVTFGLREISTDGTQFTVNGRKTFFVARSSAAFFRRPAIRRRRLMNRSVSSVLRNLSG